MKLSDEAKQAYQKNNTVCDVYNYQLDSPTFTEDPNDGSLTGRAVVTTIGVFPYLLEDGKVFNELRLPEEVFNADSLRSLQLKPLTLDHPAGLVTADNIQELQVGITGEDVSHLEFWGDEVEYGYKTDGTQLSIPLRITRKDAIDAVKNGKRALSCGYTRELELKEGTWCGIHYDGIQRNIRYNHVAIVDRGRAGDTAVIRMDNAFVPTYFEKGKELKEDHNSIPKENRRNNNMKQFVIDSVSYDVDEKVIDHINALEKERDTAQAKADAANVQIDQMREDMKGMIDAKDLNAKVKEYQAVRDTADRFGVSLDEKASMQEMKASILKVAMPALSLDGKSEDYVNALFDSVGYIKAPAKRQDSRDAQDEEDENDDEHDEEHDDEGRQDSSDNVFDSLNDRLQKKYSK